MTPQPRTPDSGPITQRRELSDAAVVSRSWGMAFATLISRITGFIRIVLLAAILGAALSSAFTVANQLPNLVAALVLEATFTAIFVPVLARAERDDPDGGAAFIRRLVTIATTLLAVATIASVAAAPLLVEMMLGRDPQVNEPLTTAFAYLLLPQVIFYGLSSVYMAILNNRNIFGPPAWAPVVNNVVAILTLVLYLVVPGELSVDPVRMGNTKLLVLGIGTTLGVVAQTAVLLVAIRRQRISLRPLWGIDDRLKKFGAMAAAMVLYVLISQFGLVIGNQIASTAAASGPAIYNYTWLVLMLPFGMIGVTVLTVVMPRLSRNAASDNADGVLADLSLATRLQMITLIPIVAFMTVAGPAIGSALFAYGKFGGVDANYLGVAITLSAFTLIPYSMVLLQLRVFYAREQPWIPILIIVVITAVKIVGSLLAPLATDNPDLVAGFLGAANGLGFVAGAILGHLLLRRALRPAHGRLYGRQVMRTVWVTVGASVLAGLVGYALDRVTGLSALTEHGGGMGSLLRLMVLGVVMLPVVIAVLVFAGVPEAQAARALLARRLGRGAAATAPEPVVASLSGAESASSRDTLSYSDRNHPPGPEQPSAPTAAAEPGAAKGTVVTDTPSVGSGSADPQATDRASADPQPPVPEETHQLAGTTVGNGRYRLLTFHGGPAPLQFWQAVDTALERPVALTLIDPEHTLAAGELQDILARTQRLGRITGSGIARILDVTETDEGGLVVSEWIRGGSLAEVAATAPSPFGGARAIQALAAAADSAHKAGVALSIDHPARLRVSIEGDVALAFPATLPGATPEDDIRGTGAALYALLIDRWPLPETGAPSGLLPADTDAAGEPIEPRLVNRSIPFQISAAAVRAAQQSGGIRTAPTMLNLLQQATAIADRTQVLNSVAPAADEPPRPSAPAAAPEAGPAVPEEVRQRRRQIVLIGGAIGVTVLLVALLSLFFWLRSILGDVYGGTGNDALFTNAPSLSQSAKPNAPTGAVVKPVRATVFSPEGEADMPGDADKAIDGNPNSAWSTDTYTDSTPFPNFKNGVGLLLQLPSPTRVGTVTVTVPSTGTAVQVRSAPNSHPGTLDDTTALTQPVTLKPGKNVIQVDASAPTSDLLLWISTMGTTAGKNRTEVSEIVVNAAG
ncbi:MAG: murein biosynthesis integral membrane protein MurJ [Mycolicibacterium sp.]|nr:murein biosynthesis integral membrane protein MurJ [Mycolicibacterium sp.]